MTRLLGAAFYTVSRYTGSYVNGEFVPTLDSTFDVWASIQPLELDQIELFDFGPRRTAKYWMFVRAEDPTLRTTEDTEDEPPDRVSYRGKDLEVHGVGEWRDHLRGNPHRAYTLVAVESTE